LGIRVSTVCHLEHALRLKRKLKWNPKDERFEKERGNAMLSRPMRSPWTIGPRVDRRNQARRKICVLRDWDRYLRGRSLVEIAIPRDALCETPDNAADYWRASIATNPLLQQSCECFAVLMLIRADASKSPTRLNGTLIRYSSPARRVRAAIIVAAAAVVIMHNHPAALYRSRRKPTSKSHAI